MRVITAAQQHVLDSGVQAEHLRLSIKDDDDNWRDLTTWPGFDALVSLQLRAAVNDPHVTFEARLAPRLFDLNLSPFVATSPLNRGFDPGADFEPLIQDYREVKIEVAIVPMDSQPEAGDWMEIFRGRIDSHDVIGMSISGRDLAGELARKYIRRERVYAFAADGGNTVSLRIWKPEMVVDLNDYVLPATRASTDLGFAKFYKYSTGGITGTVEPDWTGGSGIVDGTCIADFVATPTITGFPVEEVMQRILDDWPTPAPFTLKVLDDPDWDLTEFMQERTFVLEALRALSSQVGWDLRMKWSADDGAFLLTLYEPERDSPSVAYTFSADDYMEPKKLAVDSKDIRNGVTVVIKDTADTYPDGTPKRKELEFVDEDSQDAHGDLWAELQEDENGNIDTEAEGTRLGKAFISDCSEPDAELDVPLCRGFPWVELNDFFTFSADGVRSSADLSLAVTGYSLNWERGKLTTELQCRGKPTIGSRVHIKKVFHPGKPPRDHIHRQEHFQGKATAKVDFKPIVGGFEVRVHEDKDKKALVTEFEIHVDTDPDFTPDDTTLAGVMTGDQMNIAYNVPGQNYYATAVPRWYNAGQLVRGQPCARQLVSPARALAGHLSSFVEWGRVPLNGGFETWSDQYLAGGITLAVPDNWTKEADWGATITRQQGADGVSGDSWLRFPAGDPEATLPLYSDLFIVERDTSYDVSWWVRIVDNGPTGGRAGVAIIWLDNTGEIDGGTVGLDVFDEVHFDEAGMDPGTWYLRGKTVTAPAGARFAMVYMAGITSGDLLIEVDSVRVHRA